MEVFSTQLIKVGNSYGVIVPKSVVTEEGLKLSENVQVTLLKKKKIVDISECFGLAKGFKVPFVRDKSVREF